MRQAPEGSSRQRGGPGRQAAAAGPPVGTPAATKPLAGPAPATGPVRPGPGAGPRAPETTPAADPAHAATRSAMADTALIHLYRAEIGRLTAYRARLDTTTSWAITTSALVATFTLGNPQNPPAAFLVLMLCD